MPRQTARAGTRQIMATPHKPSPVKLAMNDDRGEKAARLQSRQALQEIHMNEIRAAASPMRKLNNASRLRQSFESPPHTPQSEYRDRQRKVSGTKPNAQNNRESQRDLSDVVINAAGRHMDRNGENNLTPMKRVPILANFEEWMKLATDNKINATNSWNFALIDYFHDMSLLKDGPGGQVNFQKASCTLDGCVKIYTSRVDSVATETGRLLSGLADSATEDRKKRRTDDEDGEDDEEDLEDDEEGGGKKKQKKKPTRSHEATLASTFASLQLKKLELEFAVDPLFKKASADFDEGGAKGLLLNHLSIDSGGRIVFDSSDDAGDATAPQPESDSPEGQHESDLSQNPPETDASPEEDETFDLASLGATFFPDLAALDTKDICPSMKTFTLGSADLSLPILKAPDNWKDGNKQKHEAALPSLNLADQTGIFLDGSNDLGFDDDDDGGLGGFDMGDDVGFGEGGEAWAKDAAIEPMTQVVAGDDNQNFGEGTEGDGYTISMQHRFREDAEQETVMAYFDKAFNSRGKGKLAFNMSLENWRIQKIQKARQTEVAAATTTTRARKEKEPFEIDFNSPISENLQELLQAPPVNSSTISLPRTQLRTKGRNLLDKDDEVVDVKAMMRLWTKPKCRIGRRKGGMQVIDEGYGARDRGAITTGEQPATTNDEDDELDGPQGDYDANFFADDDPLPFMFDGPLPIDDDDDDDVAGGEPGFVDAREMLSPAPEDRQQHALTLDDVNADDHGDGSSQQAQQAEALFPPVPSSVMLPGSFGSQLVTQQGRRLRPEYVNYARTAKKVDVRALKENMWKGMSDKLISNIDFDALAQRPPTPALTNDASGADEIDMPDVEPPQPSDQVSLPNANDNMDLKDSSTLKFTDMISDLQGVYPQSEMKDISTSYCFICLLHLANEKGLVLEGGREDGTMSEILVRKDQRVGEGYVGE